MSRFLPAALFALTIPLLYAQEAPQPTGIQQGVKTAPASETSVGAKSRAPATVSQVNSPIQPGWVYSCGSAPADCRSVLRHVEVLGPNSPYTLHVIPSQFAIWGCKANCLDLGALARLGQRGWPDVAPPVGADLEKSGVKVITWTDSWFQDCWWFVFQNRGIKVCVVE